MKTKKKQMRQTLNDLPQELRGPAQNRFGGHQTQNMKALRGHTFGAASDCRVFTEEEKAAWVNANTVTEPMPKPLPHNPEMDIKRALYGWFKQYDWDAAITLTFPKDYSEKRIANAVNRFWNEMDYQVYRNSSRRFNKKIQRVMMVEGDGVQQHVHYHGAAMIPPKVNWDQHAFCFMLHRMWKRVNPKCRLVEFVPTFNAEGWTWYMTKKASHFDCDSFDVHSSHIAAPNLLTASRAQAEASQA